MKNWIFSLLLCIPLSLSAQLEVGGTVGVSNYLGDLAPSGLWTSLGEMNFSAGVFARYNIGKWVSLKGGINYGKISASDFNSNNSDFRQSRNLSFRSNIFEFGFTGEFNILGYAPYNLEKTFSPYVFVGIAGYKFNPQTEYNAEWVNLQPLGTEGQGMEGRPEKYKLLQMSIPFGGGVKYAINDKWNLGFEIGFRRTNTDYLDDVSTIFVNYEDLASANGELAAILSWRGGEIEGAGYTRPESETVGRGNPNNLDWYVISGIFLSYNFTDNGLVGSRGRSRGKKKGCPSF